MTVPDPDLEIRGGGSPKKFFSALGALVWSKNRGAGPPESATVQFSLASITINTIRDKDLLP